MASLPNPGADEAVALETDRASPSQIPADLDTEKPLSESSRESRWGEYAEGDPVSRRGAMEEFAEMSKELTKLSLQRSKSSTKGRRSHIRRSSTSVTMEKDKDVDIDHDTLGSVFSKDDDFELGDFLRGGGLERRTTAGGPGKKIGVVFKNLTVEGIDATSSFVKTLPDAVKGTFGPDLYNLVTRFIPALRFGKPPPTRTLLHNFSGSLRDGEIMLVLGRPGAGCTTFLKSIANNRSSFVAVSGDVRYGGISAEEQDSQFRGEVNYNPEDDQHFPDLTVEQTLKFALMNKTKKRDRDSIPIVVDGLLKIFGISHTKNTAVGNEFVRGISGGERKRVGIAETLTTKSSVVCWDNSTRGLDASTALDYVKSLRVMTDVSNRTTFVTLYQAGEGIYDLMDKVMVIEEGRMLYQGPAHQAKAYFEDLGFHFPERSTTADFLTSLCDPNVRRFQPGREASTPKTAEELEAAFKNSDIYKEILKEIDDYENQIQETDAADTRQFQKHVGESKSKTVSKRSNYTVSFARQVIASTKREFWLFWGDKAALYTKFFIIISVSLIVGSFFYGQSLDTNGAFPRGGALFFSILFLGWLQLSQLMPAVSGRTIIARHKDYAFYRPSAVVIARVLVDFPVIFATLVVLALVGYFLMGFDVDVSKFFIYCLFIYVTTISITAMYRMFAALSATIDDAVRFGGISLNVLIFFVGYAIPKQALLHDSPWFGWLFYVNPLSYSFEAVMGNEFSDRVMECSPEQLVPRGPNIDPQYQGCSLPGSQLGSNSVSGARYLDYSFQFSRSHLWRNFGIVIAFTAAYILVTAVAAEVFPFATGGGGAMVFKKSKRTKAISKLQQKGQSKDEETGKVERIGDVGGVPTLGSSATTNNDDVEFSSLSTSDRVFTWNDVEYTVPYGNGERKLLNKITGYVKPGTMMALMGASGSGKTTLLNTLAQRQRIGVVSGNILVDGQSLPLDFRRGTGFCEQMDIHDTTATIREALEFSAILRQGRSVPREEKIAYVDQIIGLLELEDIQDAIIGALSLEQRKRLTIGVELAAKPNLLLFLDEPTSGLDSQAAFSIIRFLKKLSRAGQAIICTIHQPSSLLIQEFDTILALNPEGNTFYFGPVGQSGSAVIDYFAKRGVDCPPTKNVAEFILETAAKSRKINGKRIDWNEEWRNSDELAQLKRDVEQINLERSQHPPLETSDAQYEYAASITLQCSMLTKRLFLNYWRDSSYLYGKLFISAIIGIFNGFTFWQLGNTISSMQNRMFTIFMIIMLPPVFMNGILPKFFMNRMLWEVREQPSRIYGWFAFCTANIVCELPAAVVTSAVYWLLWYFATGLPTDSSTSGYVFLMCMLFFFFQASWGQWICAFAPSFTVIGNVLPFFFVMVTFFNGIMRPYFTIPPFWRYWIYYVNPTTWWFRGVLSATLPTTQVICSPNELTHFNPPPGQTCIDYAGNFISSVARSGYLTNPDATADCAYCAYSNGAEYIRTLNVHEGDKWKGFGIFLAFVVINWGLVYFMIYTVRVRGWTFGFGTAVSIVEKALSWVGGLARLIRKRKEDKVGQDSEKVKEVIGDSE
ncbi:ABC drug exporter AtrF [Histoplasma capsulatum G186AR]|uniref:ABC multidrug transporter atrF n=2 Tax=Ajellomyces capsulatus TaxID=5037 RepID=C0NZT3_AJECG|nr:ABC drug exporter AtrF [Histoplasma capsulatum G186AR]EEH03023.1 ABC drug exporter AtrF [Histoplasma capsulatum G186AR]KAG5296148.1 ABC drug exporter AtrF [Histoplasma capsulatum]QSS74129.1 ABC drug exporter AtrF [Histoplasma capsulatum G186AR]